MEPGCRAPSLHRRWYYLTAPSERSSGARRLCVFCGSSPGRDPAYRDLAASFAALLARRGIGIVYGGGHVGMMGILADTALAAGGEVIGILPHALYEREIGHRGLTKLHVVGSMHERKAMMADLSDGFVALPGGIGTMEELFEVWTWAQLGLHQKPVGLLHTAGFYDPLLGFLDHLVTTGFVRAEDRAALMTATDPEELLDRFEAYVPRPVTRWITPAEG
ncbi:MAG: TIGR00730 family Rossman fold protein [Gemmatimonadota bacterium]